MTLGSEVPMDDDLFPLLQPSEKPSHGRSGNVKNLYFKAPRRKSVSTMTTSSSKRLKRCLYLLLVLIVFGGVGIIYFSYFCPGDICSLTSAKFRFIPQNKLGLLSISNSIKNDVQDDEKSVNNPSFSDIVSRDFQFNISGYDVMVFLHIQKTGGTSFGRHLVRDLDLKRGCQCHSKVRKRCTCLRPGPHSSSTWLFSRYSTGWQCGLHADWTELTSCVDSAMDEMEDNDVPRNYFYITFLRDPVHRYLSEYRHVKRGATWKNVLLFCGGRRATKEEVAPCYTTEIWEDPSLEEFIGCEDNLAVNRQTRMLADLNLVGCYNKSAMSVAKRDEIMLQSAKQNLDKMAFFGITEQQEKSQYLFEEIFNLRFSVRFDQYNQTIADSSIASIPASTLAEIRRLNHLDVQLYEYALQLLLQRFETMSTEDKHFHEHFSFMGGGNFSWDALEK